MPTRKIHRMAFLNNGGDVSSSKRDNAACVLRRNLEPVFIILSNYVAGISGGVCACCMRPHAYFLHNAEEDVHGRTAVPACSALNTDLSRIRREELGASCAR